MFEKIKKLFRKNNEAYAIASDGNRIEVEILPADWTPEKEREYQAQRLMKEYEDAQKEKAKQIFLKETLPFLLKKFFKVFLLAAVIPTAIMFIAKQFGNNLPYFVAVLIYFFAESIFKSLFFKKH